MNEIFKTKSGSPLIMIESFVMYVHVGNARFWFFFLILILFYIRERVRSRIPFLFIAEILSFFLNC